MSLLPKNIHFSWKNFLSKEILEELNNIENKIGQEFYPNKEEILRFMNVDLKNVKYIIVGMEPYPSDYQKNGKIYPEATGRSFEVRSLLDKSWNDKYKQSSLRNILKTIYFNKTGQIISLDELREKINNKEFKIKNPKEWFNDIENQGVIFLNATLTVKPNTVDSHRIIWENFMIELIKYIENNSNCIWVLWGKPAQERFLPIIKNKYIISCHPRLNQFIKENPFKKMDKVKWCDS